MRSAKQAPFQSVGSLHPGRSQFNLSYVKTFTADMGQLIPIMCDECVPGDIWKIGNQSVVRFQPLVAPVLHEINQFVHYFFVPYRLLWEDWEDFITSGEDGQDVSVLPYWDVTDDSEGSLWDYLGFPTDVDPGAGARPIDFPRRAYNFVFNEYYRDENLQTQVALTNEDILLRNWEKDYLTSALLEQQKGTAPSLPISGIIPVLGIGKSNQNFPQTNTTVYESDHTTSVFAKSSYTSDATNPGVFEEDPANPGYPRVRVDLSAATTFDIADLRLAFQIQRWMERNNRAGSRYTEFLKAHFGVAPHDDRLQRPEYIGGTRANIILSEVLQTSSTDLVSPQGNLAGHGIGISNNFAGTYHVKEFGLIIGLMSVMPKPQYSQGINRQWLRETRYDFYFPEFANLSEQAITNGEVCAIDANPTHNQEIFGYQGRYDEMRVKQNMVCGQMRTTFNYWHLAREFDPGTPPELNEDFIQCIPRKDIFAVPSEPGLIVEFGNAIVAFRPLPITAEPGLLDHD